MWCLFHDAKPQFCIATSLTTLEASKGGEKKVKRHMSETVKLLAKGDCRN